MIVIYAKRIFHWPQTFSNCEMDFKLFVYFESPFLSMAKNMKRFDFTCSPKFQKTRLEKQAKQKRRRLTLKMPIEMRGEARQKQTHANESSTEQ